MLSACPYNMPPARPQGPSTHSVSVTNTCRFVKGPEGVRADKIAQMPVAPSGWSAER